MANYINDLASYQNTTNQIMLKQYEKIKRQKNLLTEENNIQANELKSSKIFSIISYVIRTIIEIAGITTEFIKQLRCNTMLCFFDRQFSPL